MSEEMSLEGFSILALAAILFNRAERFWQFWQGSPKEHFCEIILKSVDWSGRRCHFMFFLLFLALAVVLLSGAEPF